MAERSMRMDLRLLRAALWRKRGTAGLAVLAVTIGASVASALLHVSGDVSRKLTRELRALGPNLIVLPAENAGEETPLGVRGPDRFLDAGTVRAALARAGVDAAPVLYVTARIDRAPMLAIGTDLEAARRLHPSWKLAPGRHASWMGVRLMRRLGVVPGDRLRLDGPGGRAATLAVGASLEAGGPDDEAWWIPLERAQALSGLEGRISLAQVRVTGDADAARAIERRLERIPGLDAVPLHALTATEGRLLDRMRRLMTLVTISALAAAGLCAFGSLTDLALERRREIALMKALGATRREVVRQFAAESAAIGLLGGIAGWALGLFMAQIIGREVFHAAIAVRLDVPFAVIALSLLVSGLASLGPVRLALAVEPAFALRGE